MPLSMISPGQEGVINRIAGKDDTRRFLNNLGFVEGGSVTVISRVAVSYTHLTLPTIGG